MSEARLFRVPNRLRNKILRNGGQRAADLVARAEEALVVLRPPCMDDIDRLIGEIMRAYGRSNRKGDESFQGLYDRAAGIIDVCAPVAYMEIDRAAFFLCELVDRCETRGEWDWPSVDVHLDALQLLRMDEGKLPPAARLQIFAGLQKISKRLPSPEVEEAAEEATVTEASGA